MKDYTMTDTDIQQEILDEINDTLTDEELANAGARESGFPKTPVGKASFQVENVYLNRSRNTNRKQMVAQLVILSHDSAEEVIGQKFFKTWGLESTDNFNWLNGDLTNLNIPIVTSKACIPRVMAALQGVMFVGALVENKDPQYPPNLFINEGALIEESPTQGANDANADGTI